MPGSNEFQSRINQKLFKAPIRLNRSAVPQLSYAECMAQVEMPISTHLISTCVCINALIVPPVLRSELAAVLPVDHITGGDLRELALLEIRQKKMLL